MPIELKIGIDSHCEYEDLQSYNLDLPYEVKTSQEETRQGLY